MGTETSHQSLTEDAIDRGGNQVIFQAHVEEASDPAGRVIGVQRGQHQVAGQRRLHSDAGGFDVTHFTDHDHVGILADDRAQG